MTTIHDGPRRKTNNWSRVGRSSYMFGDVTRPWIPRKTVDKGWVVNSDVVEITRSQMIAGHSNGMAHQTISKLYTAEGAMLEKLKYQAGEDIFDE